MSARHAPFLSSFGLRVARRADGTRSTRALLKVTISGAARLEGGLHAHVRKALRAGVTSDEIYAALLLLIPTVGFPGAMAALAWARDVIEGPATAQDAEEEDRKIG